MVKNQKQAVMFAMAAVLMWSTVATAFKLALQEMAPVQLLFYAALVSWLFLGGLLWLKGQYCQALTAFTQNWIYYIKIGVLNPCLYYLILFQAYDLLPAQQAQALNYTWAIMLSVLAVPMLGQRLYSKDMIALGMAYFGVLVICTRGELGELNFDSPTGVLLALLSTVVWALYWILNTRNTDPPVTALFLCFSISLPLISVVLFWQGLWALPSIKGGLLSAYVGLFEMGITFIFWLMAMKRAENVAAVSNLIFISPFLSLVIIQYFLGEKVEIATVVGLLMIIVGLLIQKVGRSDRSVQS